MASETYGASIAAPLQPLATAFHAPGSARMESLKIGPFLRVGETFDLGSFCLAKLDRSYVGAFSTAAPEARSPTTRSSTLFLSQDTKRQNR